MSHYSDTDLTEMKANGLEDLLRTARRVSSSALIQRIETEIASRKLRSGSKGDGTATFYRRRGDWFVERGDGLRLPILHSTWLGEDLTYQDTTPRLNGADEVAKNEDLINVLRQADLVVVQKDKGGTSSAQWNCVGYVGLFEVSERNFADDGSFSLKLVEAPGFSKPKQRRSRTT